MGLLISGIYNTLLQTNLIGGVNCKGVPEEAALTGKTQLYMEPFSTGNKRMVRGTFISPKMRSFLKQVISTLEMYILIMILMKIKCFSNH